MTFAIVVTDLDRLKHAKTIMPLPCGTAASTSAGGTPNGSQNSVRISHAAVAISWATGSGSALPSVTTTTDQPPSSTSIIDSLWLQLGPFLNLSVAPEAVKFGIAHQRAAVAAIRAGDPPAARDAILRDIMESGDFSLSHADSRPVSS